MKEEKSHSRIIFNPHKELSDTEDIQAFKLDLSLRCQNCGAVLEDNEKHTSKVKVTDKDNKVIAEYTLFLCFDCIKKITGKRPDHE